MKVICRKCKGKGSRHLLWVHASTEDTDCPICGGGGEEIIEVGYIVERKASGDIPDFGVFDETEIEKAVKHLFSSRFMSQPADYFEALVEDQRRILNNKQEAEAYARLGSPVTIRFGGSQSGEYSRITKFGD